MDNGNKAEREELSYKTYRKIWSDTFSTESGKKVLREIMEECHVFETIRPDDIEIIALRNYALSIMALAGILDESDGNDPMGKIVSMVH